MSTRSIINLLSRALNVKGELISYDCFPPPLTSLLPFLTTTQAEEKMQHFKNYAETNTDIFYLESPFTKAMN